MLKKKKWDPNHWACIVMDLQQTQLVPKLNASSAYYKRKLCLYNFCVFDLQNDKAYMYVWTENVAKRGSVEIYSCLNKWINDHLYTRDPYPRNLKIFADNCGGQNKNNNMCLALLMNIHQDKFDRIELGFLVPGHSYNTCDRMFSNIARKYNKCSQIYSPDQYIDLINAALKSNKTSNAYLMKREDFLNIEIFVNRTNTAERLCYIRPTEGKVFQKATQIVMNKWYPQGYILKHNFNQSDSQGIKIPVNLPDTEEQEFDLSWIKLESKYIHERKIAPMKMKDLLSLKTFMGHEGQWIDTLKQRWKKLTSQSHEDEELENASPGSQNTSPEQEEESEVYNNMDKIYERVSVSVSGKKSRKKK